MSTQNILRREAVERVTGLPRSTLYFFVKQGTFPAPIKIGVRSVGWLESDIAAWQQVRINEARDARSGRAA